MKRNSYTNEQLTEAVKSSVSIRQCLIKLDVVPRGGNYGVFHRKVKALGIDTSHFKGQGWHSGVKSGPKRDLSVYLSNEKPIQSHRLKLRLISEKVFEHKCSKCGLIEWQGKPIPLELEHINGEHSDNTLSNLCLLCPNCHAQTDTYRGKKNKK